MWFYKGTKLNILATKQKTTVAQNYKINHIQITTIIAENTENSSNLVANTIEKMKFKIVRKSHLLLHNIGIFSSVMAIVTQIA